MKRLLLKFFILRIAWWGGGGVSSPVDIWKSIKAYASVLLSVVNGWQPFQAVPVDVGVASIIIDEVSLSVFVHACK